jgi:N-acetyltransferase 10
VREPNEQDPFEIFVTVTDIRYTYYKESHKILGQTYGMLILQDFEALTPNLLARTIETVQGGGLVVLLLKTMTSLKQLYTMTMVRAIFFCQSRRINALPKRIGRTRSISDIFP